MVTANQDTTTSSKPPLPLKLTGHCWICGADDWTRVFTDAIDLQYTPALHPYDHSEHPPVYLVRCDKCGFRQPESLPDLASYFDTIYDQKHDNDRSEAFFSNPYRDFIYRGILARLQKMLRPDRPRTLLDVGASAGRFVHVASQAGWDVEGAEIDPEMAAFASRRTGRPIHAGRAEDLALEGRHYSVVTLNDVLEHIPEPTPVVRRLLPLLHPGGILSIKVPHGPMQCLKESFRKRVLGRNDPLHHRSGVMTNFVHVNLFSVDSLRLMLENAGYRVLEIAVGAPELFARDSTKGFARNLIRRGAFNAARILPGGVRTPLSMNLQAFAMRPDD